MLVYHQNKEYNKHLIIWIRHSLQANIASTHRHVHVQIVVLGSFLHYSCYFSLFFHSTYPVNSIAKEIFWAEIYRGRLFFMADRSLGAKQEGLTIVQFLNKLIVSCKEAVRIPIFWVIFKLDSYFLF